jgi:excinuclease ABC subunit A
MLGDKNIIIKGARVHNLKNVDVTIPHNQLVVVTGVSGSGKSSLTIDTLFAEGQRRYVESLSSYARQFMKSMDKPDVDVIQGLCPAIAIEQKVTARTPRSTVGSMTEVNDYLRLLFAKIGKTYSPISGQQVTKHEVQDVVKYITALPANTKVQILMPFTIKTTLNTDLDNLLHSGYTRLYNFDAKQVLRIEDIIQNPNDFNKKQVHYVLIDRIVVKTFEEDETHRIADSIQTSFDETNGNAYLEVDQLKIVSFNNRFELDGMLFEEPTPNLFSSNNPYGACPQCEGFGSVLGIDPTLVIPDKSLSVYDGAIMPWRGESMSYYQQLFIQQSKAYNFPIHKPIKELTNEQYQLLWHGKNDCEGIAQFFKFLESNLYKIQYRVLLSRYRGRTDCPSCDGARVRKEALYVTINDKHIGHLSNMPCDELYAWLQQVPLNTTDQHIAERILHELKTRINTLCKVGLGYLTLHRTANTLSGGESQRIQLTRIIGSNLTDSLYILDEPSIGLHSRDTDNLIQVLQQLKTLGNTVVIVEHDEQIMRAADHIIDMGPLASIHGGEVIAVGNYTQIIKNPKSLTGQYLSKKQIVQGISPRVQTGNSITLEACYHHNLKDITVSIPLNCLCVVSGVSGSGKTTLIKHILYPAVKNALGDFSIKPGSFKALTGAIKQIKAVEMVDQNPIGKSSRSNPATYVGAWDSIRDLYAAQKLSKVRGYKSGIFSFNVDGGRCDTCKGEGETIVEMQFLADVHIPCESCKGKRFKEEVLEILYNGKSVHDVLTMSVDEAISLFANEPKIADRLTNLSSVGLGYISLGQSSNTLSGGEAQRVKLASFLDKSYSGQQILFVFDEPTTGLHFNDINKLLKSFDALIQAGHSIIVIEHNIDVINNAHHLIDLGPEAGIAGGNLVYSGPVANIKKCKESITGRYL